MEALTNPDAIDRKNMRIGSLQKLKRINRRGAKNRWIRGRKTRPQWSWTRIAFQHTWQLLDQCLQFGRRYLPAGVLDDVLLPVDDVEEPILVEVPDVAGTDPPVRSHHAGGGVRIAVVPGEGYLHAQLDLTRCPGWQWPLARLLVHDPGFGAGLKRADTVVSVPAAAGRERHQARLGHAVSDLNERVRGQTGPQPGVQLLGDAGPTTQQQLQGGQLRRAAPRLVCEQIRLVGREERDRDTVALHQFDRQLRCVWGACDDARRLRYRADHEGREAGQPVLVASRFQQILHMRVALNTCLEQYVGGIDRDLSSTVPYHLQDATLAKHQHRPRDTEHVRKVRRGERWIERVDGNAECEAGKHHRGHVLAVARRERCHRRILAIPELGHVLGDAHCALVHLASGHPAIFAVVDTYLHDVLCIAPLQHGQDQLPEALVDVEQGWRGQTGPDMGGRIVEGATSAWDYTFTSHYT
uniref:Uncharacterized protein n=1 Tax=Anopheles dirus TaxID=7168 RepID=A0A182N1M4_9DIPT